MSVLAEPLAVVPDTEAERPRGRLHALVRRPLFVIGALGVLFLVVIAVFGPAIAPYDPNATIYGSFAAPSAAHIMGTDQTGRDVFSRMIVGTRVSLVVGVGATAVALVLGGLIGLLAGLEAARIGDTLLMRAMDILLSIPALVFVMVLSVLALSRSSFPVSQTFVLMGAIGIVITPVFARIARAGVLGESEKDYLAAARAFGARRRDLIFSNLLPNIQAPLIVQAAFTVPLAIITEAGVSLLGAGIQAPQASWGNILNDGFTQMTIGVWWEIVYPAVAIVFTVLVFNFLGDALRDALDPGGSTGAGGAGGAAAGIVSGR
jgi:peptide/nickel transport system permease protein